MTITLKIGCTMNEARKLLGLSAELGEKAPAPEEKELKNLVSEIVEAGIKEKIKNDLPK